MMSIYGAICLLLMVFNLFLFECFCYFWSSQVHLDLTDASEDDEEEEPEEVKGAWEELIIIQREQQRWEKILHFGQTNLDEGREFFWLH